MRLQKLQNQGLFFANVIYPAVSIAIGMAVARPVPIARDRLRYACSRRERACAILDRNILGTTNWKTCHNEFIA